MRSDNRYRTALTRLISASQGIPLGTQVVLDQVYLQHVDHDTQDP